MITALLTSILETIGVFDDLVPKAFRADGYEFVDSSGRVDQTVVNSSNSKKSKNEKCKNLTHIRAIRELIFLTSSTKKAFNHLSKH